MLVKSLNCFQFFDASSTSFFRNKMFLHNSKCFLFGRMLILIQFLWLLKIVYMKWEQEALLKSTLVRAKSQGIFTKNNYIYVI